MANIKLKDLLAENMRRFKTKNLNEQDDEMNDMEIKQPSLDPQQKQQYADALVARFYYILEDEDDDWEAAVRDSAWASSAIVANILCGYDPLENEFSSFDDQWDTKPARPDKFHPYYKLKSLGYDVEDVDNYAST